jgi:hypothetical protein
VTNGYRSPDVVVVVVVVAGDAPARLGCRDPAQNGTTSFIIIQ